MAKLCQILTSVQQFLSQSAQVGGAKQKLFCGGFTLAFALLLSFPQGAFSSPEQLSPVNPASLEAFSKPQKPLQRPLKDILPYREFEQLVMHSLRRIPELSPLWDWVQIAGEEKRVFFGGGRLRALLHWLFYELQTSSVEDIKSRPIPSLKSLSLLGAVDVDIRVPESLFPVIENKLDSISKSGFLLDLLEEEKLDLLSLFGGNGLHYVYMNPFFLKDPFGGLKDFYKQKLLFKKPSSQPQEGYSPAGVGLQKMRELLRFIKISLELPYLKTDPQILKKTKSVQKAFQETERFFERFFFEEHVYWWSYATKSLSATVSKLYKASQGDIAGTLLVLKNYGLLKTLSLSPIAPRISSQWEDSRPDPKVFVREALNRGLKLKELKDAEILLFNFFDKNQFTKALLEFVQTPEEFLQVMFYSERVLKTKSQDMLEELVEESKWHRETDSQETSKNSNYIKLSEQKVGDSLADSKSKNSNYIKLSEQKVGDSLAEILESRLDFFFDKNPSTEEAARLFYLLPEIPSGTMASIEKKYEQHFGVSYEPIDPLPPDTSSSYKSSCKEAFSY